MKEFEPEINIVPMSQSEVSVCDFRYLKDLVNGKTDLIKNIMDVFISQVTDELQCINVAIINNDFKTILSYVHTMKSSVSIMGISVLKPILSEMGNLGKAETDIKKIEQLGIELNDICSKAIVEIEKEKLNYI